MIPIGIDGLSADVIEEIAGSAEKVIEEHRIKARLEYDRICAHSLDSSAAQHTIC